MKLVLAIVQDKDADTLAKEFIQNDVRATKLATSGGFLRAGNTTFIVGIEDDRVNEVLEIIKNYGFVFAKKGQLYCGRLGDLELELDEDDFDSKEEFDLLKECFKDE